MNLTPIVELGVAEAYDLLVGQNHADLPPLAAIENEDWGRDWLLSRFETMSPAELAQLGLTRDEGWDRDQD